MREIGNNFVLTEPTINASENGPVIRRKNVSLSA